MTVIFILLLAVAAAGFIMAANARWLTARARGETTRADKDKPRR